MSALGEVLSNPEVANRVLGMAGILAGLGQEDVRTLAKTPVPIWAVVAGSAAVGVVLGIWTIKFLPGEWVSKIRR